MPAAITCFLGIIAAYLLVQQIWVLWQLLRADPIKAVQNGSNKAQPGRRYTNEEHTNLYSVLTTVEGGIERIHYIPAQPANQKPVLFLHGMFHDAWIWRFWQHRLAEMGRPSIAFSLPGHGRSPAIRPVRAATIDYYLRFLKEEIDRFDEKPVVFGHSLGAAVLQWYLKYAGDDLPAAVLVAPWAAHSILADGFLRLVRNDPAILPLTVLQWDARSWIRTPHRAAKLFLGDQAVVSPEELHAHLSPESALITYQHNPPFWRPSKDLRTRLLVLAGEADRAVSLEGMRRTAAHYHAELYTYPGAGHNLMVEKEWAVILDDAIQWLDAQT